MNNEFYENMKTIAKGSYAIFSSSIIGMVLAYLSKILIIRYLSSSEYGIISLAFSIMGIFITVFSFAIPLALVRQASFESGKGNKNEAEKMFTTSFFFLLILSFFASFFLFFSSSFIATLMHKPSLIFPLKVFSIALPFVILRGLIVNIYRCMKRTDIMAWYNNILPNIIKLAFVLLIIYFSLSFKFVVIFYSLPLILPSIPLFFYFFKNLRIKIHNIDFFSLKKVLKYSFPLYFPSIISIISSNISNIVMGIYLSSSLIGIYFASYSLANILSLFLTSMIFLYYPLASSLFGKGKKDEIERLYISLTKWVIFFFFPFFLVCVLFPKSLLLHLFRKNYYLGWKVLVILALAYAVHTIMGPNGITLLSLGKPESATYISVVSFLLNTSLSIFLIPKIGILGSALSFFASTFVQNLIASAWLYKSFKIHAFRKKVLGPFVFVLSFFLILKFAFFRSYQPRLWHYLFLIFIFYIAYFLSMLIFKSIDETDIHLMIAFERKLGINLKFLKKFLKKFIY